MKDRLCMNSRTPVLLRIKLRITSDGVFMIQLSHPSKMLNVEKKKQSIAMTSFLQTKLNK